MDSSQRQVTKQLLDRAAIAIKRGAIPQGKAGLDDVLQRDPNNVLALLWYSKCVSLPAEKLRYFRRVLELDPANPHALKGIEVYKSPSPADDPAAWVYQRPDTASPIEPSQGVAGPSPAPEEVPLRKPPSRRFLYVGGAALAGIAALTCLCVGAGLLPGFGSTADTSNPPPARQCDIAAAIAFEDQVTEVDMSIVELLDATLAFPAGLSSSSLESSASLAREWVEMLSSTSKVPDCYQSLLQPSLRYDQAAARHYVATFDAIQRGDYTTAQRELDLGIDASNSAGEAYMDAICQLDVAPYDSSLANACKRWSGG